MVKWETKWYWKLRWKMLVCRWFGHEFIFQPGFLIFRPLNFCTRCGLIEPVYDVDE